MSASISPPVEYDATGVIQYDTIANSGTYDITADGAQGGGDAAGGGGGNGAEVSGDIYLAQGAVLEIVVGVEGYSGSALSGGGGGGGGGGGSFVIEINNGTSAVDTILAAAAAD
jgi:hypothetical protein